MSYELETPPACFRAIAAGDEGIDDVDLWLEDPAQRRLGQDSLEVGFALLELDGPVCSNTVGLHRIVARAAGGAGTVALEVWRSTANGSPAASGGR